MHALKPTLWFRLTTSAPTRLAVEAGSFAPAAAHHPTHP